MRARDLTPWAVISFETGEVVTSFRTERSAQRYAAKLSAAEGDDEGYTVEYRSQAYKMLKPS